MAIKVFAGKQTAEGTAAVTLLDLGATDFSGGENYSSVKSEVFNSLQAEGDQFLVGIDTSFDTPVEWNGKSLELIMAGFGYTKTGEDYKLSADDPAWYTVVVSDTENNRKTVYKDCKPNTATINAAKGAVVNGSVSWIGKTSDDEAGVVTESAATDRGESLVALDSVIKLAGSPVTEDVDSVTIEINNNLEARGSIDSLYTKKIRRSAPQSTSANLEFNTYDHTRFNAIKAKAIANSSENLEVKLLDGAKELTITLPKLYISTSERGDYKGAGTHSLAMTASVNNADRTPIKFNFGA